MVVVVIIIVEARAGLRIRAAFVAALAGGAAGMRHGHGRHELMRLALLLWLLLQLRALAR
jgi:uncharacterized membrane protein